MFKPQGLLAFVAWVLASSSFPTSLAQEIDPSRGIDSRVDYQSLTRYGPWDDRNYHLTLEDLRHLSPEEASLQDPIPAFFRVFLRKTLPLRRSGKAQYPSSTLPRYLLTKKGYRIDGKYTTSLRRKGGRYVIEEPSKRKGFAGVRSSDESRVTSPNSAAESAVAIHPTNPDLVIAGSNGPGTGQDMHYSTDGGETWSSAAPLPYGGTCCDPTVEWSSDGLHAYTATLGLGEGVFFYRSSDHGQTWNDLEIEVGGDARREIGIAWSDKEYLHVDHSPTSPHQDNIYMTWHEFNVLQFARSTDRGHTWTTQSFSSASDKLGIGSDITTDADGAIYYIWPTFYSKKIWVRKSVDGGVTFAPAIEISTTEGSFDFPIPSQDLRNVFIYTCIDSDRSSGPYAGSLYAAWTDSTAPTTHNATDNHARIRFARSRDGGSTWTVTVPHSTNDLETVDRWHPWFSVDDDGSIHLMYYDTSLHPARDQVDVFYTTSHDGGQSFDTPRRLTTASSPNIGDTFEFGDYNGLDVRNGDVVTIFTDNRLEGGGPGGDSVDVYVSRVDCPGTLETYGAGCEGSGGHIPTLFGAGCPSSDESLTVSLHDAVGSTLAFLLMGSVQASVPLSDGCTLLVVPSGLPLTLPVTGSGAGGGSFSMSATVPTGFSGSLLMQAFVIDPGVPRGYASTNGIALSVN